MSGLGTGHDNKGVLGELRIKGKIPTLAQPARMGHPQKESKDKIKSLTHPPFRLGSSQKQVALKRDPTFRCAGFYRRQVRIAIYRSSGRLLRFYENSVKFTCVVATNGILAANPASFQ